MVNLFEDSQGNLYLHQEGSEDAWCVRPGQGSQGSFATDAAAVVNGDTVNWTAPRVEWPAVEVKMDEDGLRHIASWEAPGQWRVVREPTGNARRYVESY